MKRKRKKSPSYRYFLILVALSSTSTLFSNPEGMQIVHGLVQSSSSENLLEIHSGQKAILNWDQFSIAAGETAKFIQQDANSAVLNRVVGNHLSEIYGAIESNGKIFLINPSGILFGEGSRIEVGSFIASTFDILNEDFLSDNGITFAGDSDHALVNLGTIRALEGDVFLIAHRVRNDGKIEAPLGEVSINSCQEFLLQPKNSKILIRPQTQNQEEIGIENNGSIEALQVSLESDGNLYAQAIFQKGMIEAKSATHENGRIRLVAENSRVTVTGDMTAKSGEDGGTIHVLGKEVLLLENARLDASGMGNGGEVLIGGDYQGKNPDIYNADVTYVDKDATILADSHSSGNGGRVILWGEKYTGYYGSISAKGGPISGDGGFTEISSPGFLSFENLVDLSAKNGNFGTLLLDPVDVTISNGTQTGGVNLTTNPVTLPSQTSPVIINNGMLQSQLSSGSVTIYTSANGATGGTGNVQINNPVSWPSNRSLTLIADGTISIGFAIGGPPNQNMLTITNTGAPLPTVLSLTAGVGVGITDTNVNNQDTVGGDIVITSPATVITNIRQNSQLLSTASDIILNTGSLLVSNEGLSNCCINAGGDLILQGINGPGDTIVGLLINNSYVNNQVFITAQGDLTANCRAFQINGGSGGCTSKFNTVNGDIRLNADTITLIGGFNINVNTWITSTNGSIDITANNVTIENSPNSPPGSNLDTAIFTNTGSLTITCNSVNNFIDLISGNATGTKSSIRSSGGDILIDMPRGPLNLINDHSGRGESPSSCYISNTGSGTITINAALVNINTAQDLLGYIQTVDGDISGTIQNLNLIARGRQDTTISCTGMGSIHLMSTANSANYSIQGNGSTGNASISTMGGDIDFTFTGTSGSLSLSNTTTASEIVTKSGGNITLDLGSSLNSSLKLTGGTSATNITTAEIHTITSGDITLDASNITLMAGNTEMNASAIISTDTTGTITLNSSPNPGNSLTMKAGTSAAGMNFAEIVTHGPNNPIQAYFTGPVTLMGGSGGSSNVNALITTQNASGNNSITISSGDLSLYTSGVTSTDFSNAEILTNSGNIGITATGNILLQNGEGQSNALISASGFGNGYGAISITSSGQAFELFGGASVGSSLVAIETTDGGAIGITLNSPTANGLVRGGSGSASPSYIQTHGGGNITITQNSGSFDIEGNSGARSQAAVQTLAGGNISFLSSGSGANISLSGGSGTASDALIQTSSTSPGDITIDALSLSLDGGESTGSGQALIATGSGLASSTLTIDVTNLVSLMGGGSTGNDAATIEALGTSSNTLMFTAGSLEMAGGTGSNSSSTILTTASSFTIDITGNTLSMKGGSGTISNALINTLTGGDVTISAPLANISLQGGSSSNESFAAIIPANMSGNGNLSVTGNNISLTGGSGSGNDVAVLSTGQSSTTSSFSVTANGNLSLTGGNGSGFCSASIINALNDNGTSNSVTVKNNLSLTGGDSATHGSATIQLLSGSSVLNMSVTNLVTMNGGIGSNGGNNQAAIIVASTDTLMFRANGLEMTGGSAPISPALLESTDTSLTVTITGSPVTLTGGSGSNSQAFIGTLNAGNVTLAASNASISLTGGSGLLSTASIVPSLSGSGQLLVTGNSLSMLGGNGSGNDNAILTGPRSIQITLTGNGSLTGGTGAGSSNNALISAIGGNPITIGAANFSVNGSPTSGATGAYAAITRDLGDIQMTLTGSLTVAGGVADNAPAIISAAQADIDVLTVQNVSVIGGSGNGSYAQIGRSGSSLNPTNITFSSVTGNVAVTCQSGQDSYALIGFGSPTLAGTSRFDGDISFPSIGGNVVVTSGTNIVSGGFAQIGVVNSTVGNTITSSDITLHANGNVTLTSLTGTNAYALIGGGGQMSTGSENFFGDITLTANNLFLNRDSLTTSSAFSIVGFASPGTSSHPLQITSDFITVQTNQNINAVDALGLTSAAGIGALALSSDPSTSVTITNLNLTAGGSINYLVSSIPFSSSLNFIGTVLGRNALGTASSDITIQAGGNFEFANFGIETANESLILNCNPNNFSLHHDPITITVGGSFTALEIFPSSMIIFSSGILDVTAGGDITLSGLVSSGDGMLMIAGNNFSIEPFGVIQNVLSGDIILVSDNQNSDAPAFGKNTKFSLFAPATITNIGGDGPVGIYSTTQANTPIGNKIDPSINRAVFRPGTQFVNTPQEKWFVYYPDGNSDINPNSPFFTIFYKAGSEIIVPPVPTVGQIEATIYLANLLISQMLFWEPPILDEYLFWAERFDIKYNYKAYRKLKKSQGYLSSFDLFPKQKFTQERKRYFEKYDFIDLLLKREIRN